MKKIMALIKMIIIERLLGLIVNFAPKTEGGDAVVKCIHAYFKYKIQIYDNKRVGLNKNIW